MARKTAEQKAAEKANSVGATGELPAGPEFLNHLKVLKKAEKVVNGNLWLEVKTSDGAVRLIAPADFAQLVSSTPTEVPKA